jgi:hypothetical protein
VARISVKARPEFRRGKYLYLVGHARIHAARERNALLPVILRLSDFKLLDETAAEVLLGSMIREGTTPAAMPEIDAGLLDRAYAKAYEALEERFRILKKKAARVNDAMIESRIASLQQSYEIKIQKKRHLLSQAVDRRRDARYIRMLQGYIRHVERERGAKVEQVEDLRQLTGDFSEVAAGYLNVY